MTIQLLPEELQEHDELDSTGGERDHVVVVYNNDKNTWDEVMDVLQRATGCTEEEAYIETWEVDNLGKSVVHYASQTECERAAAIIRTIGIRVEVNKE